MRYPGLPEARPLVVVVLVVAVVVVVAAVVAVHSVVGQQLRLFHLPPPEAVQQTLGYKLRCINYSCEIKLKF